MLRILILILFFSTTLKSQDVEKYYQLINKAESQILNDSLISAVKYYESAFRAFDRPFSKDLYNALICSIKIGEDAASSEFIKGLIRLGCNLEFFRNNESFRNFIKTKYWLQIVDNYPSLRNEYFSNTNLELRSRIESFLCRDQFWRNQDPSYTILRDTTFKEDDRIMDDLAEIFENGYPGEYQVGLFFANKSAIDHFSTIALVLLHNFTSADNYKVGRDLSDLLLRFVKRGELHNGVYAYLYDRSGDFKTDRGFGSHSIWKVKGKYYTDKPSDEILSNQELKRKKIGLDPLDEFYRKFAFQEKNQEFQFFTFLSSSQIDLPDEIVNQFSMN